MDSLRIIVTGLIGQYPLGGISWHYLQFVVGLKNLGHDVFYLEDTGQYPYNPAEGGIAKEGNYNAEYLGAVMGRFGLEDRWAYLFPWQSQWFGLSERKRQEVVRSADVLINVSGTLQHPDHYRHIPRLIYIDTDPVFTQVKLAKGQADFRRLVEMHDVQFSFGESMSEAVPDSGIDWLPTRQPVVLAEWQPLDTPGRAFTTVMNWTSYKPLSFNGTSYGQKDVEFERFIELPKMVPEATLEIAVNSGKTRRTPRELLSHKGWHTVNPDDVCPDLESYRSYIRSSRAEWSVAKNGYVVGQSGWFSDRTACYLAAGRPVVVQETGFSKVLPTGTGIVPFSTLPEAVEGIRDVQNRYDVHRKAAREIAEQYFDSALVLRQLLERSQSADSERAAQPAA